MIRAKQRPLLLQQVYRIIIIIEIITGLEDGAEVVTAPYNVITKKLKNGASLKKVSKEKLTE